MKVLNSTFIPTPEETYKILKIVSNYSIDADDYTNFKEACTEVNLIPSWSLFNYYLKCRDKQMQKDITNIQESIEKHNELNPILFDQDVLKEDIREQILKVVNTFTEELETDGIDLLVKDIVIIGSNASYNYTKDSDLDIHIITDTSQLNCSKEIGDALYSAYRSLFSKKFEIEFYGIPVELYVETEDVKTVSNGIYSVKENYWIKQPVQEDIPDLDEKAFKKESSKWIDKAKKIIADFKADKIAAEKAYDIIVKYLEEIYDLRKSSLASEGEYSIGNLSFKEVRNLGLLDELKDLKNEATSKILSLESLKEQLNLEKREKYRIELTKLANGRQPIIQENGYFHIHNIPENEVDLILSRIGYLDYVVEVRRGAAGRFDFNRITRPGQLPTRLFTITGRVA